MFNSQIKNKPNEFVAVLIISLVILLMTFYSYELSGESAGYWVFADELFNKGHFIIQSRSPLYTLYLQLFNWIGMPFSIILEWIATSLLAGISLYLFLRLQLTVWASILAVVFWLPFIRYSEPPVQSLALSMTCIAIVLRSNIAHFESKRKAISLSYLFLIMSFMFRVTYILPLLLIFAYDLLNQCKLMGLRKSMITFLPKTQEWYLIIILIFFVISSIFVSEHPWNNAWFSTTNWFPVSGSHTSLGDGGFIQSMNWKYIEATYGNFFNHDFYYTNNELFGEATTLFGALQSNPGFIFNQWWLNILELFEITSDLNLLTNLIGLSVPFIGGFIGVAILLYGAIASIESNKQILIFLIATIFLIGSTAVGLPKIRYMVPAIPFLIFSAVWYTKFLKTILLPKIFLTRFNFVASILLFYLFNLIILAMLFATETIYISDDQIVLHSKYLDRYDLLIQVIIIFHLFLLFSILMQFFSPFANEYREKLSKFISIITFPVLLLTFSPASSLWLDISKNFLAPVKQEKFSYINSKDNLLNLAKDCNGIMTMEHNLISLIFSDTDTLIYDIWEIPPFGNLNNSSYDNLDIDRIDCLLISDALSNGPPGKATNHTIRYENYIKPYESRLLSLGASLNKIEGYGRAVVYNDSE